MSNGTREPHALPFTLSADCHSVEDVDNICTMFFSTVHTWLPVLSESRLRNELSHLTAANKSDVRLLVLCMSVFTESAGWATQGSVENVAYNTAKACCSMAEASSHLSLRLVQSLMLLAVYEMAHDIHPAAYLTIGRVARLATIMRLYCTWQAQEEQVGSMHHPWSLREERRRACWAIFILDR